MSGARVDYRQFRLSKLGEPEFRHVWYLAFWPVFGLFFLTVERLWIRARYVPIHCPLDDAIPFLEGFLIPYWFWFVFMVGTLAYVFFADVPAFRRMMRFIILSFSVTMAIYLVFPNCQELRPAALPRDNVLTRLIGGLYAFDTNTNVCPSLHVVGSAAAVVGAWRSRRFSAPGWRAAFLAVGALISVSTVFLKQHSVLDVAAALPVCALALAGTAAWGRRDGPAAERG